jgi:hypothetical protein
MYICVFLPKYTTISLKCVLLLFVYKGVLQAGGDQALPIRRHHVKYLAGIFKSIHN